MVPLHLATTTIHVDASVADRLVQDGAAEWLGGVLALVATRLRPEDVAAAISLA